MTSHDEPTSISLDLQAANGHREFQAALEQLACTAGYAQDADRSPWDFAVEIDSLINVGLTTSDLRWLVTKGYVEHAQEVTSGKDARRRFQVCRHLAFGKRTCFVLTTQGMRLDRPAGTGRGKDDGTGRRRTLRHQAEAKTAERLPSWDNQRRILSVGLRIVKKYRVPSLCQEAVLSAFEEEGWPPAIDDPLPPQGDQEPKRRLRDTIKSLNTNQVNPILNFRGDGSGLRSSLGTERARRAIPFVQVREDVPRRLGAEGSRERPRI